MILTLVKYKNAHTSIMTAQVVEKKVRESVVEPYFHQFFQHVVQAMPHVDPQLLIKVMMFEMTLKDSIGPKIPHVHLEVQYKEGIDLHQKQEEGRDKYPIQITKSRWGDAVIFSGLMSIKNVELVCSDPDIVKVTGRVCPRHN